MGDGLNPTLFTSNPDSDIRIIQENVKFGEYTITINNQTDHQTGVIQWRGWSDTNGAERFMSGLEAAQDLFNYYRLVKAEYIFFISTAYSTGDAWNTGLCMFRICPWTGNINQDTALGNNSFPPPSLLTNCEHYIMFVENHRADRTDPLVGLIDVQRQARVMVIPQYKQDSEPSGTPILKANYNQAPLQIYSETGRDDTLWRGLYLQIDSFHSNTTGSDHQIFLPFVIKYTIEFSGQRWLPTLPTDN